MYVMHFGSRSVPYFHDNSLKAHNLFRRHDMTAPLELEMLSLATLSCIR
jgi:hypothetical protein